MTDHRVQAEIIEADDGMFSARFYYGEPPAVQVLTYDPLNEYHRWLFGEVRAFELRVGRIHQSFSELQEAVIVA